LCSVERAEKVDGVAKLGSSPHLVILITGFSVCASLADMGLHRSTTLTFCPFSDILRRQAKRRGRGRQSIFVSCSPSKLYHAFFSSLSLQRFHRLSFDETTAMPPLGLPSAPSMSPWEDMLAGAAWIPRGAPT
jgi:hypothetical protein